MTFAPIALPSRAGLFHLAETLAIASCGSFVFSMLGVPGGAISGASITVAIAAIAGRPMAVPRSLANWVLFTLGMILGSVVSPELLANLGTYSLSITLLAVATVSVIAVTALYLRAVHGWTPAAAILGASPGALSQIVSLALDTKTPLAPIAVVQTLRVVALTVLLPSAIALAGGGETARTIVTASASANSIALTALAAAIAASALHLLKFPGAWIFGSMLGSALIHGSGLASGRFPNWLALAAMVSIGAIIGSRFARMSVGTFLRHLGAGAGAFAVSTLTVMGFALVVIAVAPGRLQDVAIAFSPGAMDAMMALALTMHVDPVFVGAHHLVRFIVVSLATPLLFRLRSRKRDGVG